MKNLPPAEIWFVTGSQHLYGEGPLKQVAANSQKIVAELNATKRLPLEIVFKPILTRPEEIRALCLEANGDPRCAGLVIWCHTFSPSKMWIGGLLQLRKPVLHLATQFNRDLPWADIDMDFMNLNQAAHGDREHGFITRACGSRARSSSGIGVTRKYRIGSVRGCAWLARGPTGRAASSCVSVTTCVSSP